MDSPALSELTRVDYACLRGLLAIEIKTLEEPSGRLDNLAEDLRKRDDWPIFLGGAPIGSFVENTEDPEGLSRKVLDRVGRAIVNHLKKANKQLKAHTETYHRQRVVRLLVLINEDHELYDPHTVSYILWNAVRRKEGERPLFDQIDAILYLTQRHAAIRDDLLTFPILTVDGRGVYEQPWKAGVVSLVSRRWSNWNGHTDRR